MIVTLGTEAVPGVRIALASGELLSGQEWAIAATYTDGLGREVTYRPRGGSGVGAGESVALVDYAAPVNVPTTYKLTRAGAVVDTETVTRPSASPDVLTSMNGGVVAPFWWDHRGGAPIEPVRRFYASTVPGSPFQPLRLAPVVGAGMGSLVAETVGAETVAMEALLYGLNAPAYLLHSCGLDGCDIPLSRLVYVTGAPSDRVEGGDPTRAWSLTFLPTADPEPDARLGVSTWADLDAAALTWNGLGALGLTWDAFDMTDWTALG